MKTGFAWAKNPMIHRFENVQDDLPVTILYGENSWIRKMSDDLVKEKRPNAFTQIKVSQWVDLFYLSLLRWFFFQYIVDAGHHINADQPELFNEVVAGICDQEDQGRTVKINKSSKESVGNDNMVEIHPEEDVQTAQINNYKPLSWDTMIEVLLFDVWFTFKMWDYKALTTIFYEKNLYMILNLNGCSYLSTFLLIP